MRESAALKPADVEAKSSAEDIIRCFTESIANGDTATIAIGMQRSVSNMSDETASALLVTGLPSAIAA